MTDVFNIDLESECFRRNNFDWRKFREKYNKLSATKLERGIKPLPLTLLLKLFGQQKVLNTYVVTRRNTTELDYFSASLDVDRVSEMKANEKEKAVAKTLNFPGNGVFINSDEINEVLRKSSSKLSKHDGLPSRPVFQRHLHVPGRYFPKPAGSEDGPGTPVPSGEGVGERPRTLSPRPVSVATPATVQLTRPHRGNGFKGKSVVMSKNCKVIRGSVCKATDTLSCQASRAVSGRSNATARSGPLLGLPDPAHADRRHDLTPHSALTDSYEWGTYVTRYDANGDVPNDTFNIKRLRLSARQVTFPKSSHDFSTILQGRPKTLHRRELTDSVEQRLPRARTHVGFAESEMT